MSSFLTSLFSFGTASVEFLINWWLQSTLLIVAGLFIGRLLKNRHAALLSVVYRATLVAALLGPCATGLLAISGASGWSLRLPVSRSSLTELRVSSVSVEQSTTPNQEPRGSIASESDLAQSSSSPTIPGTFTNVPVAASVAGSVRGTLPSVTEPAIESDSVDPVAQPASMSWIGLVAMTCWGAWISISIVFLIRLQSEWSRVQYLRRTSVKASPKVCRLCSDLAATMGVRSPDIRHSPLVSSPFLVGLVRPVVMLPEEEPRLLVREVLIHELAHLRRGDCYWNLLLRIAGSVFFFQPLLAVLAHRIELTAEDVCDDYVVRFGGDRSQYASQLLDIAELSVVPALGVGMMSLRSMLGRRVSRIMDGSRNLSTRAGHLIVLTAIVVGVTATMAAGLIGLSARPTLAGSDDSKSKADDEANSQRENKTAAAESKPDGKPTAADKDSLIYEGMVVDPAGKPVSGAKLYLVFYLNEPFGLLEPTWKPIVATNAKGQFRFSLKDLTVYQNLDPDEFSGASLCATADGYGFAWSIPAVFETSGQAVKSLRERAEKLPPQYQSSVLKTLEVVGQPMRLKADDQLIQGQIVTVEGKPVKGAKITLLQVQSGQDETLDEWLKKTKEERADYYSTREGLGKSINGPQVRSLIPPLTSDAEGKFVLRGIGRDRIVELLVEGPGIQSDRIYARTRPGDRIQMPNQWGRGEERNEVYYPDKWVHVAGPSQPIAGVVVDKVTKKPIPGALIVSQKRHGHPINGWGQDFVRTLADSEGRFQLEGMPIGDDNKIGVIPPSNLAYLSTGQAAKTDVSPTTLRIDFELQPGVWIAGQVTDKQTGKGLSGHFQRFTFASNDAGSRNGVDERQSLVADHQGRYRIVVAPGHGILAFQANLHEKYPRGAGVEEIKGAETLGGDPIFKTQPYYCMPQNFHRVIEMTPSLEQAEIHLNFTLDASRNVQGQVVDPSGKPLPSALFAGKLKNFNLWDILDSGGRFEIVGHEPTVPRTLAFVDRERKLAARVDLVGEVTNPLIVTLQRAGNAVGRIVDDQGAPIPNLELQAWTPSAADPAQQMKMAETYNSLPLPPTDTTQYRTDVFGDANGRFELQGLVPGQEYRITAIGKDQLYGPLDVVIKVKAGETLELGDLRITDEKSFLEKFKLPIRLEPK